MSFVLLDARQRSAHDGSPNESAADRPPLQRPKRRVAPICVIAVSAGWPLRPASGHGGGFQRNSAQGAAGAVGTSARDVRQSIWRAITICLHIIGSGGVSSRGSVPWPMRQVNQAPIHPFRSLQALYHHPDKTVKDQANRCAFLRPRIARGETQPSELDLLCWYTRARAVRGLSEVPCAHYSNPLPLSHSHSLRSWLENFQQTPEAWMVRRTTGHLIPQVQQTVLSRCQWHLIRDKTNSQVDWFLRLLFG